MNELKRSLPLVIAVCIFVILSVIPFDTANSTEKIFRCSRKADLCSEITIDNKTKKEIQTPLMRLSEIQDAVVSREEHYKSGRRRRSIGRTVTYYRVSIIDKYASIRYKLPENESKDNAEATKTDFSNYLTNKNQENYRFNIEN